MTEVPENYDVRKILKKKISKKFLPNNKVVPNIFCVSMVTMLFYASNIETLASSIVCYKRLKVTVSAYIIP